MRVFASFFSSVKQRLNWHRHDYSEIDDGKVSRHLLFESYQLLLLEKKIEMVLFELNFSRHDSTAEELNPVN